MVNKNLQLWEIRLGATQVAIGVGVLVGSLVCAFGIGYISGQKVGFENAMQTSIASIPNYPIESENELELTNKSVKDVYAKLEAEPEATVVEEELPKLGKVKSADSEPIVDNLVADLLNESAVEEESDKSDSDMPTQQIADKEAEAIELLASNTDKTLADLVDKPDQKQDTADKIEDVLSNLDSNETDEKQETGKIEVQSADTSVPNQLAVAVEQISATPSPSMEPSPSASVSPKPAISSSNNSFLKSKLQPGWYVQVSAPESLDQANQLASQLKASGFPVSIEKAQVQNQTYYRLLVGPEDNRAQGERMLEQVKREKYINAQPFLRMSK